METKTLKVVASIKPSVNEKVVTALRAALKDAKEGRIQAIGIAIACFDPESDSGRSTETILSAADGWDHSLTAVVGALEFRMQYERYGKGYQMPDPVIEEGDE